MTRQCRLSSPQHIFVSNRSVSLSLSLSLLHRFETVQFEWPLYGLFPLRMYYKKFVRGHAYRIVCCAVATLVHWLYARGIVGFLCGRDSIGIQTSL